jgi:excisionase family DNA binding protein
MASTDVEPGRFLPIGRVDGSPWSLVDAAEYLHVSSAHLRRLVDAGKVRSIRLGRRVLIPDVELRRVAAEGV